jgi:hypothetical protein
MLGIGRPQQQNQQMQQPQYAQGVPVAVSDSHDMINGGVKELDTEIQKYFLNVDPLLNAYYHVFSAWRDVADVKTTKMYGISVPQKKTKIEIDWFSRSVNESGSNFLWNETLPLVHQTASTSKTDRKVLYDLWHTHIFTIRMTLLKTYYYPTYMCNQQGCKFLTPSQRQMDFHAERMRHYNIDIVENPYELNIQRYSNIISMLITLYGIALKSDKGFAMEQFAQSFQTATLNRIGLPSQQQQQGGLTSGLKRMGIG